MTAEAFNEYLVSIGGLIDGHYADRPPKVDCGFMSIQPGWYQLVHDLIVELVALGWDKNINQVKEKFGGLRFYAGALSTEMHRVVDKYMELSWKTCEVCGKPGELRVGGWAQALCEEHAEGRKSFKDTFDETDKGGL